MKNVLMIVGAVFLIGLIGGGVWIASMISKGAELDASSRAFVEEKIPELARNKWYGPYMRPLAHSAFMEAVSMEDWQRISTLYWQKLGMLNDYGPCEGQATMNYTPEGEEISAEYVCDARFEKANATIELRLFIENNDWKLVNISVNSPVFLNQ